MLILTNEHSSPHTCTFVACQGCGASTPGEAYGAGRDDAPALSAKKHEEMKAMFDELDADKNGRISRTEIIKAMTKACGGEEPSEEDIMQVCRRRLRHLRTRLTHSGCRAAAAAGSHRQGSQRRGGSRRVCHHGRVEITSTGQGHQGHVSRLAGGQDLAEVLAEDGLLQHALQQSGCNLRPLHLYFDCVYHAADGAVCRRLCRAAV